MQDKEPILEVNNMVKRFPGTKALDRVNLKFYRGEIHCLLGENGAGKSTLIKILSGVYKADEGSLVYKGEEIGLDTEKLSLSIIHQDLGLVDGMSVMENIALSLGYPQKRSGLISWKRTCSLAREALEMMDCRIDPYQRVDTLNAAEKSVVAIARALVHESDILILDEPTATLGKHDVEVLFRMMNKLKEKGIALIFVTHRMDEVFAVCDRVSVLRDGKLISSRPITEADHEELILDIVGKQVEDVVVDKNKDLTDSDVVLEMRDVEASFLQPVNFQLRRGEVLALYGLRGAGHHETGRCLWGCEKQLGGEIRVNGKKCRIHSPKDALECGIGFVSSKRLEEGIAIDYPVSENLYLNPRAFGVNWISPKKENDSCGDVISRYRVKTTGPSAAIGTLSGGNQQKICVARWIEAGREVFIMEEPTIGVDVGAKADIYSLVNEILEEGRAVLLISSDYEEVCKIAHRVLVYSRGDVVKELTGDEINSVSLNSAAAGM